MMIFTRDDTNRAKGVAIILLLFHHCFVSPDRYVNYAVHFPIIPEHMVNHFAMMARICVAIFTFLSAYGMMLGYKKRKQWEEKNVTHVLERKENIRRRGKAGLHTVFREYRHRLVSLIGNFSFVYILVVLWGTLVMKDGRIAQYGTGIKRVAYVLIDALGMAGIMHTPTYLFTWWYESLAIVVILILPFLILIYRKCGIWALLTGSIIFAIIVPVDNISPYETLQISNYLFCICLGMIAADRKWIEKVRKFGNTIGVRIIKFFLEVGGIGIVLELNMKISGSIVQPVTEGMGAFLVVCFVYEFLGRIPLIGRALCYIGGYSGDIYLIHNMIRGSWCGSFIYGFHYPLLIVTMLLLISLLLAIGIKGLQRVLHYDKLLQKLR